MRCATTPRTAMSGPSGPALGLALSLALSLAAGASLSPRAAIARPALVAHAGVNASDLHQDDLASDARFGPAAGLGAHTPLGQDGWHVGAEVWYQQKGLRRGTLFNLIDLEVRAHVVSVPVLLSYWFPGERTDARAFAGIAADLLVKSELREPGQDAWQDVTDQDDTLSWVLVLGGGIRVLGRWDLDVRYQHGLSPLTDLDWTQFDDRTSSAQVFDDATDSTWTFSLGAWF